MIRRRLLGTVHTLAAAAATAVVTVAMAATPPAGAAAAGPSNYPVPYGFLPAAVLAGAQPDTDPPGANIWTCVPSGAHPAPVVLVHGLAGNKNDNWQTFAPLLANNGYCVYALTYGTNPGDPLPLNQVGGRAPMENSATELAAFVTKVLAATGATKVDILGHSEGTQVPDYYAKFLGGARYIDKYVSLAPLWHGTDVAGTAALEQLATAFGFGAAPAALLASSCASCVEFGVGSPYYRHLGNPVVPGIAYTNIVTRYDELVMPYTSGIQAGMTNIVVQDQCPTDFSEHLEIAADPVAAADVLNALDPAHPRPVPCRLVLPLIGA
jgi:triacylglycerol esterase/lipase EstA (alpha/beta hydrolase family)